MKQALMALLPCIAMGVQARDAKPGIADICCKTILTGLTYSVAHLKIFLDDYRQRLPGYSRIRQINWLPQIRSCRIFYKDMCWKHLEVETKNNDIHSYKNRLS